MPRIMGAIGYNKDGQIFSLVEPNYEQDEIVSTLFKQVMEHGYYNQHLVYKIEIYDLQRGVTKSRQTPRTTMRNAEKQEERWKKEAKEIRQAYPQFEEHAKELEIEQAEYKQKQEEKKVAAMSTLIKRGRPKKVETDQWDKEIEDVEKE